MTHTKTILIVDDTDLMRQLLKTRLERAEYNVIEGFDGKSGIQQAIDHHPNLIVLDLMMPDMHGYDVMKALRANDTTVNIPVVVMTAAYDALSRQRGVEAGAVEVLQKPTPFEKLLTTIREHAL